MYSFLIGKKIRMVDDMGMSGKTSLSFAMLPQNNFGLKHLVVLQYRSFPYLLMTYWFVSLNDFLVTGRAAILHMFLLQFHLLEKYCFPAI